MAIEDAVNPAILQVGNANSAALEASHVLKASAGKLFNLVVYNDKGSAQYVQVHDAAALPANGVIPVMLFKMATVATQVISFGVYGKHFINGIVVVNSSTAGTLTIGSADCWFSAELV